MTSITRYETWLHFASFSTTLHFKECIFNIPARLEIFASSVREAQYSTQYSQTSQYSTVVMFEGFQGSLIVPHDAETRVAASRVVVPLIDADI